MVVHMTPEIAESLTRAKQARDERSAIEDSLLIQQASHLLGRPNELSKAKDQFLLEIYQAMRRQNALGPQSEAIAAEFIRRGHSVGELTPFVFDIF